MGYEIYITRARNYLHNKGDEISPDEWEELVRSDKDFTFRKQYGEYYATLNDSNINFEQWLDW